MRELDTPEALTQALAQGSLESVVVQGLDLRPLASQIEAVSVRNSVFLGCDMTASTADYARVQGAICFPRIAGLPYDPYRPRLYTLDDLMQGYERGRPNSFQQDARDSAIYRHFQSHRGPHPPILECLAQRLHDHAIDDALADLLNDGDQPRKVVAIMGGHAMLRDEPIYAKIATIARELTLRGYFLATGGGPGAMEAANLGAWFANYEAADLAAAIATLTQETSYRTDLYLELGYQVRDQYPNGRESLAIPTWFYGHEPTNQFATHIAKYFANSLREDGLLAIATHGVVFAPGSAGTISEIFMDATQNHYATFDVVSPMVMLGSTYWTQRQPVYPTLQALAKGRAYAAYITLADEPHEVIDFLATHPPLAMD